MNVVSGHRRHAKREAARRVSPVVRENRLNRCGNVRRQRGHASSGGA